MESDGVFTVITGISSGLSAIVREANELITRTSLIKNDYLVNLPYDMCETITVEAMTAP